jgi:hypothetical protein
MSVLDLLKKGFGYVLMSMGVSSPGKSSPGKSSPRNSSQAKKPAAKPEPGATTGPKQGE